MQVSAHIDEAFKAIKTATGVTDIQELVHKFLTREQTYSELLVAVADSESRIDKLRRENEVLRARLNELKIGAEEMNNAPSKSVEYDENMRDESGTSEQSEMFSSVKLLQKYNNVKIVVKHIGHGTYHFLCIIKVCNLSIAYLFFSSESCELIPYKIFFVIIFPTIVFIV